MNSRSFDNEKRKLDSSMILEGLFDIILMILGGMFGYFGMNLGVIFDSRLKLFYRGLEAGNGRQ